MRLNDEQTEVLLRGIIPARVQSRDGMSYVEAWDIRAMMNRVFGFCGWSLISTSPTTLVFEREWPIGKDKRNGFKVAYKAELELIIHTPDGDARYAGSAIGEAIMPDFKLGDAHDMAAKSAESGALKRAATNLGDQFGLSLYRDGSLEPVVRKVVGFTPTAPAPAAPITPVPVAPAASSPNPDIALRFEKLDSRQRVALARYCSGKQIPNFMEPEGPEHLDLVLTTIGKLEKGEKLA